MFKIRKTWQKRLRKKQRIKNKFPLFLCGILAVTLVLTIGLTSCASPPTSNVTVDEAQQLISEESDLLILDVRTQQEYNSGHIPNAILIPVGELEDRLGELDETKPILVYCKSGVRSAQARQILVDNGFPEVYNLEGGIVAWQEAGMKVNHLPIIEDLIVTPEEPKFFKETNIILKGKSCDIKCVASDPDKDELSYEWLADGGSISGEGLTVTWTAPLQGGKVTVTVTVSDSSGDVATKSTVFTVKTCSCAFS